MKITDLTPQVVETISIPEPAPAAPSARKAKAPAPVVVVMPATEQVGTLATLDVSSVPLIAAADADGLLTTINARIAAFAPDLSGPTWQAECRSTAADIAKAKASLDRIGLGLTEGYRKSTSAVNEERNLIKGRFDALRDAVRKPLTAWEQAEESRKADHEAALADIRARVEFDTPEPTAEEIRARLTYAEATGNRDWQEFADQAAQARADAVDKLNAMLVTAERREAEQAELEQLRAERAERDRQEAIRVQAERDRKAAEEAAEKARKAAAAEVERAREEERAKAAADLERIEAEAGAALERVAKAEKARLEAIEQARLDAIEAEERAAQAEIRRQEEAAARERQIEADRIAAIEQARLDALAAVEAERKRVAEEAARVAAESEKRASSNRHKGKINREALADLMASGFSEDMGKQVIEAIARGQVRHVRIDYSER